MVKKVNLCLKKTCHRNDRAYKACHLALLIGLSLLLYFAAPIPARALLWPVTTDVHITGCKDTWQQACSQEVYYSGKIMFMEQGKPTAPRPPLSAGVMIVGIHCEAGGNGVPFRQCSWSDNLSHRPELSYGCKFVDDEHWDIKDTSQCSFGTTWGPHGGAGPGGECVMIGTMSQSSVLLYTPWGALHALDVANSGARNCAQPLAPQEGCSVGTLQTLVHGALGPTDNDIRTTYTNVSCGLSPKVTIVGGSTLNLGPGVSTTLTAKIEEQRLAVRSDLTITGAKPGAYSGNAVIMVSPD